MYNTQNKNSNKIFIYDFVRARLRAAVVVVKKRNVDDVKRQ